MATGNWEYVRLTGEKGEQGYSVIASINYGDQQGDSWNKYEVVNNVNSYTLTLPTTAKVADKIIASFKRIDRIPYETVTTVCEITSLRSGGCNARILSVSKITDGAKGDTGAPAKLWTFNASHSTYPRDLRSSDSFSIDLEAEISGYDYTPTWTTSAGTLTDITGGKRLSIPRNNTYDSVTVTMSYGSSDDTTYSLTFSVVDITIYGLNFNTLTSDPTGAIFASGKPRDFYTYIGNTTSTRTKGSTYEWNGSAWVTTDNTQYKLTGLGTLLTTGIDLNTLNDANTVSYFRDIIARTITAETISALQGNFVNLHITGDSEFDGRLTSSSLSTTNASGTPVSKSLSLDTSKTYWSYDMYETALDAIYGADGYYGNTRKGNTSKIRLGWMEGEADAWTAPRTQRVEFYNSSSTGGPIYKGSVKIVDNVKKGASFFLDVVKGETYRTDNPGSMYNASFTIYDDPSTFPRRYTFFDSNGVAKSYVGDIQTEAKPTSTVSIPSLYKWNGIDSAKGGGRVSTGTLTFKDKTGSVNISSASLYSAVWNSTDAIAFTTTDGKTYTITTDGYYQAFSSSFAIPSSIDSIVAADITPKTSSTDIGTSTNMFQNIFGKYIYATQVGSLTSPVPNIYGTNVYGAVFN